MNKEQRDIIIAAHHKPELEKEDGMVCQLWEDGEITLQKSGRLMWQRNLHCIISGGKDGITIEMPKKMSKHSYMVVTGTDEAQAVWKELIN
jgi:hypothetical protein